MSPARLLPRCLPVVLALLCGWAQAQTAGLPYELRQTAQRYPVTLYTTDNCAPCQSARALLLARGIPYIELTVNTPRDGQAFKTLSADLALPMLTIGTQQLKGFSPTEWQLYLSAAGYPEQSRLPAGYRAPPPAPLGGAPASPAPAPAAPLPALPPPGAVTPGNPAGIVF